MSHRCHEGGFDLKADPYASRNVYRCCTGNKDLLLTRFTEAETDRAVYTLRKMKPEALSSVSSVRAKILEEIKKRPEFLTSLVPIVPRGDETEPVRKMLSASRIAGTGPMAAVAGLIAETAGRSLLPLSPEVIIENGGDIFLCGEKERIVAVFAGTIPLSGKIGIRITPKNGYGICTSSGTYGHSLSFGKADAAIILAPDTALADAAATMLGNKCTSESALEDAVNWAASLPGVDGAIAIIHDRIAISGACLADRIVALEGNT